MSWNMTVGRVKLENLPAVWGSLDNLQRQLSAVEVQYARSNLLCDRRFDEAEQVGRRVYILAHSLIVAARDSHEAFRKAIFNDAVRPQATWGMIRPSFEASFYAAWLLQGSDSRTRKQRGMRVAWQRHMAYKRRVKLKVELAQRVGLAPDHPEIIRLESGIREDEERYLEDGRAVGLSRNRMGQSVNLTQELGGLANLDDDWPDWTGTWLTLVWRQLSGATHGDWGALVSLSDRRHKLRIPGGSLVQVSVNDDSFRSACQASAVLQAMAMKSYIERSTRSSLSEVGSRP